MSDGWKLVLDLFNAGGTVISIVGAILSLTVLSRIRKIRGDLLLRVALPDLKKRMATARLNLKKAVQRKGSTGDEVAELRALAQDLSSKVAAHKDAGLCKLQEATTTLIMALQHSDKDPDRVHAVPGTVTTVLSLIESAERDQKTWSLSR
jgi:uncharacterized membrane protein YccC